MIEAMVRLSSGSRRIVRWGPAIGPDLSSSDRFLPTDRSSAPPLSRIRADDHTYGTSDHATHGARCFIDHGVGLARELRWPLRLARFAPDAERSFDQVRRWSIRWATSCFSHIRLLS